MVTNNYLNSSALLGKFLSLDNQSILYRGIGHKIDLKNVLGFRILSANPTTYYASSTTNDIGKSGVDISLISAIQARNNARLLFTGSLDLFSNEFFSINIQNSLNGNDLFTKELSKWVFGESSVLRFRDVRHNKVDGTPPDVILHEKDRPDLPTTLYPDPEITRNSLVYRIKDEIVYSMIVEILENGKWKPFQANDMQMEFVMLDPYVRKTMVADNTGKFVAIFTAPDNYGIFKFRVLYRREGYSVLHAETQVSIRPFKHDEYERFISSAYPYYSSAISAVIGIFIFSISFIFSTD